MEVPCLFRFVLVGEIQRVFVGVFNKTIIPLAPVGYEMIIAELLARAKRARSGAPWVRKFGKLSIRENLVMT